jgi:hypothetical protein
VCYTLLLLTLIVFLQEIECFFHSVERIHFAQRCCSSPMKTLRGRQHSFKMLTCFTLLNNVQDPLPCYINHSLPRGTVLLWFTWERRFCTNIMCHTWESWEFGTLLPKNLVNSLCWKTGQTLLPLQKMQGFLPSTQWGYRAQRWWYSTMRTLRGRQYCFHILTPFSQGNEVLDPCAYSIDSSYKT